MLLIAGQTAGPIGLNFYVDTPWVAGGRFRLKNSKILFLFLKLLKTFFSHFLNVFFNFFFQRATPDPSARKIYSYLEDTKLIWYIKLFTIL